MDTVAAAALLKMVDRIKRSTVEFRSGDPPRPSVDLTNAEKQLLVDALLRQAASQGNAGGEAVAKLLDWQETFVDRGDGSQETAGWEADGRFGPWYDISMYFGSDSYGWKVDYDSVAIGDFDDPDRAKQAAQADFEQRVKDALSPPVKTGGEAEASNGGTTYSPIGRNADGIEVYKRDARPVDEGALHAATQVASDCGECERLGHEVDRLRSGYGLIMNGLTEGRVGGEDVVWFDSITTLYDFCGEMLGHFNCQSPVPSADGGPAA